MQSWDPRIASGIWDESSGGQLVDTIKGGSAQSVIIMNGLDLILSPSLELSSSVDGQWDCLMPSEVTLSVGLITLVNKPSLDISCMLPLLDLDSRRLADCDGAGEGHNAEDDDDEEAVIEEGAEMVGDSGMQSESDEDACRDRTHFPYRTDDLTNALKTIVVVQGGIEQVRSATLHPLDTTPPPTNVGRGVETPTHKNSSVAFPSSGASFPVLKVRFEASLAEISLRVTEDFPLRSPCGSRSPRETGSGSSGLNSADKKASRGRHRELTYRQLIKPFSLHFVQTLDLHPFLDAISPASCPLSAYNRDYYLPLSGGTISTTYLSIDGLTIESSLLDIVQLLHVVEATQSLLKVSRSFRYYTQEPPTLLSPGPRAFYTPDKEKDKDKEKDGADLSDGHSLHCSASQLHTLPLPGSVTAISDAPSTVLIIKMSNADIRIVPASDYTALPVLGLVVKCLYGVLESPSIAASQISKPTEGSRHVEEAEPKSEILDSEDATHKVRSLIDSVDDEGKCKEGCKEGEIAGVPNYLDDKTCSDKTSSNDNISGGPSVSSPVIGQKYTFKVFKIMCGDISLTSYGRPLINFLEKKSLPDALSLVTQYSTSNRLTDGKRRQSGYEAAPFLLLRGCITEKLMVNTDCNPSQTVCNAPSSSSSSSSSSSLPLSSPILPLGEVTQSVSVSAPSFILKLSVRLLSVPTKTKIETDRDKNASQEQIQGLDSLIGDGSIAGYFIFVPGTVPNAVRGVLTELLEGFG